MILLQTLSDCRSRNHRDSDRKCNQGRSRSDPCCPKNRQGSKESSRPIPGLVYTMSGRYRCGEGDEGGSAARDAAPSGDEAGSAARDAAPLPNNENEGGDGDARAAAMAIEASRTSGGAPTAAIAGNTAAVVMTTDNLVQALPPLASIWKCAKIRQFETENKTKK